MAEEIDLSVEETDTFINLWEAHEALWDMSKKDYKSRQNRQASFAAIAEAMAKNWTTDQVRRKIESLATYYQSTKKKILTAKRNGTEKIKVWIHYDRIRHFLSKKDHKHNPQLASSNILFGDEVVASQGLADNSIDSVNSCDEAGNCDLEMQCYNVGLRHSLHSDSATNSLETPISQQTTNLPGQQIINPQPQQTINFVPPFQGTPVTRTNPSASQPSLSTKRTLSPLQYASDNLPAKRKCFLNQRSLNHGQKAAANNVLFDMAAKLISVVMKHQITNEDSNRKDNNALYGQYVAERLNLLRNQRRLLDVRHRIDCVIYEALMKETAKQNEQIDKERLNS